jgi:uncharacterized membrane protein YjjP (DUF1212 family)
MSDAYRQTVLLVFSGFVAAALRDWSHMSEDARMTGFDAVVRVANLALQSSGEGVETLERYVARTASAYGIAVDVVVLPEQIILREKDAENVSNLAVVRATPGIFRLDQLAALKRILVQIERGLDADAACRQLDAVEASPPRWPWWARVLGVALFAAGFAPSVVATWSEVGAAAVLGIVMGLLLVATQGRPLEGLLPFLGAFVITTLGLTTLPSLVESTGVTLIVLPALFITVPGDTLSAAAAELLGMRLTAGAARLVFAFYVLGLIVIGIVAAAGITGHVDDLFETVPPPQLPELVVILAWAVFCVGLVLAFNAQLRVLAWLIPSVIVTFLIQQGATIAAGSVVGTLVAGAILGAYANIVGAHPERPPRLVLVLGGFFVLTVGGLGVRGVTALFGGDPVAGLQDLGDFALQVPTVALALAIGVIASKRWANEPFMG